MFFKSYKRATIISALVGAFLIGLWIGHNNLEIKLGLVAVAGLLVWLLRRTRWVLFALIIFGLTFGIWRGFQSNQDYQQLNRHLGQKVTLTAEVVDDPAVSDKNYVTLTLGQLRLEGVPVLGQVRLTSPYAKLQRGYQVSVAGKLTPTLGSRQAQMFALPTVLSTRQNWLERWRQRFFAGIRTALPEPLAAFGLGLLIGTRTLIPKATQDQLTAVGLSHLVAVSGYNLTILVNAAYGPLRRVSKYLATAVAIWLIVGFLVVSGFSASIIRAAVVSILVLLASYYGAKPKPITLIAIAAGLTAAWRPEYLWSDLGWQLSFLAFFGIMVLAPALNSRFIRRPNWIKNLLVESLSAQIMTFPLIALIFGRLSVVSPLTNFIILPLVPAAMLLSFVAGLAGEIIPAFSGWLSWPAAILLHLILAIISWFSSLKWASLNIKTSNFEITAFYLLALLILTIILRSSRLQLRSPSKPETQNLLQTNQKPSHLV